VRPSARICGGRSTRNSFKAFALLKALTIMTRAVVMARVTIMAMIRGRIVNPGSSSNNPIMVNRNHVYRLSITSNSINPSSSSNGRLSLDILIAITVGETLPMRLPSDTFRGVPSSSARRRLNRAHRQRRRRRRNKRFGRSINRPHRANHAPKCPRRPSAAGMDGWRVLVPLHLRAMARVCTRATNIQMI